MGKFPLSWVMTGKKHIIKRVLVKVIMSVVMTISDAHYNTNSDLNSDQLFSKPEIVDPALYNGNKANRSFISVIII